MLNVLMYSQFGMKKTRTAVLKFPKPMRVLDCDGGMLSLRDELPGIEQKAEGEFECKVSEEDGFPGKVTVHSFAGDKKSYFDLLETTKAIDPESFRTLVLDSASEMSRVVQTFTTQLPISSKESDKLPDDLKQELLYLSRMPRLPDWGGIVERSRQVLRLVRDFKHQGKFVVVTALEQIEYEEVQTPGGGTVQVPTDGLPNLPGKVRSEVPALFDECWRITTQKMPAGTKEEPNAMKEVAFAQTGKKGIWYAKSRLNLKPFPIDNTHKIIRMLYPNL